MTEILKALRGSLTALVQARVWLYILTPAIVSLLCLIVFSLLALDRLVAYFLELPPMIWITAFGAIWLAKFLAFIGGWAVIVSLCYLLVMLLASIVVMPLLLSRLSETEYADLAKLGQDGFATSTWKSLSAALLFILGWLCTMPLWLLPGVALIHPLFWMAWLNRRTFSYDALSLHATEEEMQLLCQQKSKPLFFLGALLALLAYVPFLGLLAPSFAALSYIHYCLNALRDLRQGSVVAIIDNKEIKP